MGIFDPDRHDNFLGIENIDELNVQEALGILRAEEFLLDCPLDFTFSIDYILQLHTVAFGHLYEWAGKWRNEGTNMGIEQWKIPNAMAQYCEQVTFFKSQITDEDSLLHTLAYTHHKFTQIHPFNNGNGRTARLLTDHIAQINDYQKIELYYKEEGESRTKYKAALRAADNYDDTLLKQLIKRSLRRL